MASVVENACLKMDIAMSIQAGSQLDLSDLENLVNTTTIKENRLNIRCKNHARKMVNKAAAYAHVSISGSCFSFCGTCDSRT